MYASLKRLSERPVIVSGIDESEYYKNNCETVRGSLLGIAGIMKICFQKERHKDDTRLKEYI